jgi:hypothetical protein
MALPKPPKDYYELEEIAAEFGWNVKDLLYYSDKNLLKIRILVSPTESFPLSAYQARQAIESPLEFVLSNRRLLPYGRPITLVITHKEKMKFEEICLRGVKDPQNGQTRNIVDEAQAQDEMVRKLTPDGVNIKDSNDLELKMKIASELKAAFPQITSHRVGVLLTPNPDCTVSVDAFRKRGRKLLGLTPGKKKKVN